VQLLCKNSLVTRSGLEGTLVGSARGFSTVLAELYNDSSVGPAASRSWSNHP
jgi:hypothetical protein